MSCKRPKFPLDQDPDYEDIIAHQNKRMKLLEKDANERSIKKIQHIVKNQFAQAIAEKELEIDIVDKRLNQARIMLDRVRAYTVAGYYSPADKYPSDSAKHAQTSVHPAIKKLLCGKRPPGGKIKTEAEETAPLQKESFSSTKISASPIKQEPKAELTVPEKPNTDSSIAGRGSRFKVTKRILVGNTSKYIPVDQREPNDNLIYKWMVYVDVPKGEASIGTFVKKVSFVLHPSFGSNNVVEVTKPPFRLIRRGWGEFPIRVQIDFHDPRNKSKTVVHSLKFDKTLTGLETCGPVTDLDVHIYKPEESHTHKTSTASNSNNVAKSVPSEEICREDNKLTLPECSNSNDDSSALSTESSVQTVTVAPAVERVLPVCPERINNVANSVENVTKNEVVLNSQSNEIRTIVKPQITVFPNKTSLLTSPRRFTDKIVVLSPSVEKKTSGSLVANRQEKQIIVSPSANLIRNDSKLNTQWTAGVSLLQKAKPNPSRITANNQVQRDSSKNPNTLIIVPNSSKQEKTIVSTSDKPLTNNIKNKVRKTNVSGPLLVISSNSTSERIKAEESVQNVNTAVKLTLNDQSKAGNNFVPYIKCINEQGELFLVPETLLKISQQQSSVLPKVAAIETNETALNKPSPLPMYHLQVMPTSGSTTQAQLVPVKSPLTTSVVKSNAMKVSSLAQIKLKNLINKGLSLQSRDITLSSPIIEQQTKTHTVIESFVDMMDVVKYFTKLYPIIADNRDKSLFPYCTSSIEAFFSWNIGRQRTAEWQRAKAVQKAIQEAFKDSAKWEEKDVWSTKQILWWCRRWGFSPMKTGNEKTENVDCQNKAFVLTYTEATNLCNELELIQNKSKANEGKKDDLEIDIVSIDDSIPTTSASTSPIRQSPFDRVILPQTPELEFVQEAITKIGVKLKPVEVFPGVLANIVDEMILAACKCFLENLVRRSFVQGFQRLGNKTCPSQITWDDIYHCIQTVPEFGFLTNALLGKNIQLDAQLSKELKEK